MPNFYANDVLKKGSYCFDKTLDLVLAPIARKMGLCKSLESYGFRKDKDGNPLIEDCQKETFFIYYTSPESLTLFRSLYHNN